MREVKSKIKGMLGVVVFCMMLMPVMHPEAQTVVMDEQALNEALAGTETEIVLGTDITTTAPIDVQRNVTIDGGGQFGIIANYAGGGGNKSILTAHPGVTLTLKDIVLSNSPKYGVQAYNGGTVVLDSVRIQNSNFGAALVNGGGTIIVKDLTLWDNNYGIEFGLGDHATGTPSLIIDGTIDFTKQTKGDKLYVAPEDNVQAVNVETTANAPYQFTYADGVFTLTDNEGNVVATSNDVANTEVNVTNEETTTPEEPTTDEPTTTPEEPATDEVANPETADNVLLYVALAVLGLGAAVVATRKLAKNGAR